MTEDWVDHLGLKTPVTEVELLTWAAYSLKLVDAMLEGVGDRDLLDMCDELLKAVGRRFKELDENGGLAP